MVDLFRQLSDDADDIAEGYRRQTASAATEREKIAKRLIELDQIEHVSRHLAARLTALKNTYIRRDQARCPSCALNERPFSLMQKVNADTSDGFGTYTCAACGFSTSVPLKDRGRPPGHS